MSNMKANGAWGRVLRHAPSHTVVPCQVLNTEQTSTNPMISIGAPLMELIFSLMNIIKKVWDITDTKYVRLK